MEEFHVTPGSRVEYDPSTGTIRVVPPPGSQPVTVQGPPKPKSKVPRWPLEKYLIDGQKVRLRRNRLWEGVYDARRNTIVRGDQVFGSFTAFVNGYNLQTKGKKNIHTPGIQRCELETNGVWAAYKPTP